MALSGGVDSTALAFLLSRWAAARPPAAAPPSSPSTPAPIHALIIDHRLRPESSEEASLVARRAEGLGLQPAVLTVQWAAGGPPAGGPYQEAARAARCGEGGGRGR